MTAIVFRVTASLFLVILIYKKTLPCFYEFSPRPTGRRHYVPSLSLLCLNDITFCFAKNVKRIYARLGLLCVNKMLLKHATFYVKQARVFISCISICHTSDVVCNNSSLSANTIFDQSFSS